MRMHEFGDNARAPILLMHGAGADHQMWQPQLDTLAAAHQLLVPDLPGTECSPEPFVLDQVTKDLVEHIQSRGIGRVHVCGLSLGALVGLHLAATRPSVVASLVLSGVQLRPPPALMAVQRALMRATPWKLLGATDVGEKRRVMRVIDAVRSIDLRDECAHVHARTLVMCGAKDRLNLRAARQAAAAIPDATLKIVPGAGHQWNEQLPEVFNEALATFLTTSR